MAFLTEWITNIVIFIMLAMIVDMLLPDSSMRKYVKLVTGLLLITIVITPVFKLFSADVEDLIAAFFDPHDETGAILQEKTEEKKRNRIIKRCIYIKANGCPNERISREGDDQPIWNGHNEHQY